MRTESHTVNILCNESKSTLNLRLAVRNTVSLMWQKKRKKKKTKKLNEIKLIKIKFKRFLS